MTDAPAKSASGKRATARKLKGKASDAVTTTTDSARDLARRTSAGIEANPMSVLVGGVALGVLAGAFVPRGERETRMLGAVGKRITDTARGAVDAAKDTAKSELDVLGLTRSAARDQASKLLQGLLAAITAAGAAALTGTRDKADAPVAPPKPPKTSRAKKD